jgi:hypothetical protein
MTAELDVRVGDTALYHGQFGAIEAEVLELLDQYLVVRRRWNPVGDHWGTSARKIRLENVIEVRQEPT